MRTWLTDRFRISVPVVSALLASYPRPLDCSMRPTLEAPTQTPHRKTGSRRAQIGIQVGEAHEPRALGRKARDPAGGQRSGGLDRRPHAVLFKNMCK